MKKLLKSFFALATLVVLTFQISGCKKDCPAPTTTTYPIQGLWIGTFSVDAIPGQGSLFYSFVVYPDGTLLTKGKGGDGKFYYSSGTWTLSSSNVFSGTITSFVTPNSGSPVTQSITATYANSGTLVDGVWNDTNNPNGTPLKGKFSTMQRIN
jgi:hypothetical protein